MSNQKNKGAVITIYMLEGDTNGITIVKKPNWDGVGLVCPRDRYLEGKKERNEFRRSGVYILIGDNEGEGGKIYIGESGKRVSTRIDSHYSGMDFWEKVVIFTRLGDGAPLEKSHVKYLESRLLGLMKDNKRFVLANGQPSEPSELSEESALIIDSYLDNMLSLLSAINIRVFEREEVLVQKSLTVYYCKNKEAKASGYPVQNNKFKVLKDSTANKETTPSTYVHTIRKRNQIIEEGILIEDGEKYRFAKEYEFNTPSEAACVVAGHNVNGNDEWKDKNDVTLKKRRKLEVKNFD